MKKTYRGGGAIYGWLLLAVIVSGLLAVLLSRPSVPGMQPARLWHDEVERKAATEAVTRTAWAERWAAWQRQANWLLLADLGPRVWLGARDTLFLADEFTVHPERHENASRRAETVRQVATRLAGQGTTLLVVIVPDKSRVLADALGHLRRPAALASRTAAWTAELQRRGVSVLDLSLVLSSSPEASFFRTDTHWTEAGSRAAAQAVAERLHAFELQLAAPVTQLDQGRARVTAWGDLVKLAGIDGLPDSRKPAPDETWQSTIQLRSTSDDLFGDQGLPSVVVWGTSFSRRSNFLPLLAGTLGHAVADYALDGGDFSGAARRYLAAEDGTRAPPAAVVWEIPERFIEAPLTGDEADWVLAAGADEALRTAR